MGVGGDVVPELTDFLTCRRESHSLSSLHPVIEFGMLEGNKRWMRWNDGPHVKSRHFHLCWRRTISFPLSFHLHLPFIIIVDFNRLFFWGNVERLCCGTYVENMAGEWINTVSWRRHHHAFSLLKVLSFLMWGRRKCDWAQSANKIRSVLQHWRTKYDLVTKLHASVKRLLQEPMRHDSEKLHASVKTLLQEPMMPASNVQWGRWYHTTTAVRTRKRYIFKWEDCYETENVALIDLTKHW